MHGYYEINPEEAKIVKLIFGWVGNDGLTLRTIVRKLHELGIKPRNSKRGVWNTSTLSTMLRNKAYIGEARWGSSYAVVPENPTNKDRYRKMKKSSRKIKPEEEWVASKIPVPSIIDVNLFTQVREQLKTSKQVLIKLDPARLISVFAKKQDYEPFAVPIYYPVLFDIN